MKKYLSLLVGMMLLIGVIAGCGARSSQGSSGNEEGSSSSEDKIVVKFSHVVAENTPKGKAANKFEKLAEKYTNGKVDVQVFPNSQLYSDDEVLSAIQQNNVQLAAPATSKVSKLFPEWQVFDLPFAFPDTKAVQEAMESEEIGGKLFSMLKEEQLLGLSMWDNGFKQMTLDSHTLKKPSDFEGEKFRVMSSKVLEAQFEAVDANPTPMPFSEVYSALEQGVINGQENTLSNIYSKKFHEVQDYMTISNHGYLGYAVITNNEFWQGLPDDVRKNMEKALNETTKWVRENGKRLNDENLKKIKEDGTLKEIHKLTEEEKQAWIKAMDPVYKEFEEEIGKDLIDAVKGLRE
ncbi:DctP family TRAP transporter solute-binding subunit [Pontibacillus yanchengensis]|uniref:DctP family TRAP transporter solute-binding subunit n=2 Tax=Pontibacillus yanchengensis TaxID=462910 RepID=A0ACC7VL44_9BACI|nr:TRAP transporter substrate-binding protein [Pontibacillus yanchengensis]MYL35255.1 DctP family TRAP transporter solute-binding subunit [Pontibacillus yanchengensis]MYL54865.1 DctP family TRAP transporter solute-binding subunit [Pontibacillus yanchengensis]